MRNTFFNLLFNATVSLFLGSAIVYYNPGIDIIFMSLGLMLAFSAGRVVILFIAKILSIEFSRHVGLAMAVNKEVWETFIAENLYKVYSFIKRAKDRSSYVLGNAVVHIPQAGAKPRTSKNRENFPIPMVKRNDSDITYPIDELSTDSTSIPNADTIELSYDKQTSVFGDHVNQLSMDSARDILDRWYPSLASKIVRTSGTAVSSYLTGSTGNRKKAMVDDIGAGKTQLNLDTKRESGDRAAIMDENFYNQLKSDPKATDLLQRDSVGAVWSNGDLIKIHGFDIIRTDVTGRFDNSATPVKIDYNAAGAATDNAACLLVDFAFVHFALGDIKFFESINDVHHQADIYNALIRFGGRKERADEVGVVAVVQVP